MQDGTARRLTHDEISQQHQELEEGREQEKSASSWIKVMTSIGRPSRDLSYPCLVSSSSITEYLGCCSLLAIIILASKAITTEIPSEIHVKSN
jgi:hypothetical protein